MTPEDIAAMNPAARDAYRANAAHAAYVKQQKEARERDLERLKAGTLTPDAATLAQARRETERRARRGF